MPTSHWTRSLQERIRDQVGGPDGMRYGRPLAAELEQTVDGWRKGMSEAREPSQALCPVCWNPVAGVFITDVPKYYFVICHKGGIEHPCQELPAWIQDGKETKADGDVEVYGSLPTERPPE